MKTLIFIGSNKSGSSREAIKAAERLGFFTVLLTDRELFLKQRLEFPDVHQMILANLTDNDQLIEKIKEIQTQGKQIVAILSFIDPFVHVAAALSKEFCSSTVSPEPIQLMEDKILTHELLKGLPVSPYFAKYTQGNSLSDFIREQKEDLPLVVKSPISTGSKDVLFAKNKKKLKKAIKKLLKKENEEVLVEEYLEGPQYLIEALVHNGKVHIVAIIEQEITFFKRFIVTGYCLLADMEKSFYNNLSKAVNTILEQFEMKNGACHLEMRLVNGEWKLVEVNPRISGGAMNRMIEIACGVNLVEETIKVFLGQEPNLVKRYNQFVYTHYLTVDSRGELMKVTGKNRCSRTPGVEEVFIKPKKGKILQTPLSMGDRYGYVIASSKVKEEAIKIAKESATEIKFHLKPLEISEKRIRERRGK
ncbi:ATP-grasp domain-containing protein [Bacillus aerolatus]|uniref:ATP-grasp domain-containing protein n=1 Tax=Bacillus aerolatus TaxID=2653354 RepID=A0A6I1FE95_9BACI|nr:ATP-grasp domain-containing protein [Bacillus aerolatus]KAB7705990.1 ATP-grasp domain-containing protein [Bacillus aerolatus]